MVGGWVGNNATSWLHLTSGNLSDSQLSSESKMEPSVAILEIQMPCASPEYLFVCVFQLYCTVSVHY